MQRSSYWHERLNRWALWVFTAPGGSRPSIYLERVDCAVLRACRSRGHVRLSLEIARAMRARRYRKVGNAAQVAREFGLRHAHTHRVLTNQLWKETNPWTI
jgi:hypothetical protein